MYFVGFSLEGVDMFILLSASLGCNMLTVVYLKYVVFPFISIELFSFYLKATTLMKTTFGSSLQVLYNVTNIHFLVPFKCAFIFYF